MDNDLLIQKAKEAMKNSYSPYSNFSVGSALLTMDGKVYTGCNIENASYGATNCAERTAFFKAISEGERSFSKIAIVSSNDEFTFPCGICAQVMAEFMLDGEIVLSSKDSIKVYKVSEILPYAFKL
jgi:cytidine deaminase